MIKNRTPQKTNTMKRIKTNLLALYHNVLCYVRYKYKSRKVEQIAERVFYRDMINMPDDRISNYSKVKYMRECMERAKFISKLLP